MLASDFSAYRRMMWGMRRCLLRTQNLMSTGFLSNIALTCLYAQPSTFWSRFQK